MVVLEIKLDEMNAANCSCRRHLPFDVENFLHLNKKWAVYVAMGDVYSEKTSPFLNSSNLRLPSINLKFSNVSPLSTTSGPSLSQHNSLVAFGGLFQELLVPKKTALPSPEALAPFLDVLHTS